MGGSQSYSSDEEDGSSDTDSSTSGSEERGTDATCDRWFWGHADSTREPPDEVPALRLGAATLPLRLGCAASGSDAAIFYEDFAKYVMCPHFLDKQAKGAPPGEGCPFLGGAAYLRHADVTRLLSQVPADHAAGAVERHNELGYLLLAGAAFPSGTLGLGNSAEDHRVQRQWFEHLFHPRRLPNRARWLEEAKAFLAEMRQLRRFKVRKDVSKWWQIMLWKHILGETLTIEEAVAFAKFQSQWLQSSLLSSPAQFADSFPSFVPKSKVWGVERLLQVQQEYRERIKAKLPREVPVEQRELVAQGVLEAFVFAGGLSVPQTIHCAVAVLFTKSLLPSPVSVTEANVEAFVYEVTRLFPAVQGFCFWRGGERQIMSLNAALRDPAVWGEKEANRFSLKPLELYRSKHVGFANPAKSAPGTFDSKACPGYQMTIDAVSAFVLAVSAWQPTTESGKQLVYWSPTKVPKPMGVEKKWFNDFSLEIQDWLDGDQTGENLLRGLGPVDLARLLQKIGLADATDGYMGSLLGRMGPKKDREAGAKLVACDATTRMFYELSRKRFKELSKRTASTQPDETPKGPAARYFDLDFGGKSETIRLPIGDTMKKKIRDAVAGFLSDTMKTKFSDELNEGLDVSTRSQRCAAIMLCQQAFFRTGGEAPPPHSKARPDSYLPKAKAPFTDITLDEAQVAIARCGMGQLFLRTNDIPQLSGFGDVVCDVTAIAGFNVRPSFERLGAAAAFSRDFSGKWKLTAIDWRHGNIVVKPGEADWEHAKWVWRCSMVAHMTAMHHLVWTHWITANALASSCREALGPKHPVRRLLQAVTYNTFSINHNSALSLFPESGMLHRMSCFEYDQLQAVFAHAAETWRFQTWPQVFEETKLPESVKAKLPMFEDGLEVWQVLYDFVSGYISVHYRDDAAVVGDAELRDYWKFSCVPQYAKRLPPLSKASLIDQITRSTFDVTAYHELVGDVVAYTTDPAGAALQVRPGKDMADIQEFLQVNSLVAGTGTPMPMFVASGEPGDEDWLAQLDTGADAARFSQVSALYGTMMDRLRKLSAEIQRRNASGRREMPFGQMDPLAMERSVSL